MLTWFGTWCLRNGWYHSQGRFHFQIHQVDCDRLGMLRLFLFPSCLCVYRDVWRVTLRGTGRDRGRRCVAIPHSIPVVQWHTVICRGIKQCLFRLCHSCPLHRTVLTGWAVSSAAIRAFDWYRLSLRRRALPGRVPIGTVTTFEIVGTV